MKKLLKLYAIIALSILPIRSLCDETTHWECDTYAYQYDMAVYFSLSTDGEAVTDYSDYELAAFCGDECRGVAKMMTVEKDGQTTTYGYLRIRSNQQTDETINFKVYVKYIDREVDVEDYSMDFVSQAVLGLPSSPVVLDFTPFTMGDVNNDQEVSSADLVMLAKYILNEGTTPIGNKKAADMNGDGNISSADLVTIARYILNH